MPVGFESPGLGYTGFFVVKLLGYTGFAHLLSRVYKRIPRRAWLIGATRTGIGMVAGALYFGLHDRLQSNHGDMLFLLGLIPLRIAEWWLLIWLFHDRDFRAPRNWGFVFLGTLWSYLLDVPAIIGLIITGGVWIC